MNVELDAKRDEADPADGFAQKWCFQQIEKMHARKIGVSKAPIKHSRTLGNPRIGQVPWKRPNWANSGTTAQSDTGNGSQHSHTREKTQWES